ncbi:MAG TPA: hypothetical protein VEJ39_01930 [Candidatus Acidoferrales bacterium]|nr:hypothetical protein [Candidatus Acidoferrales bacterium]
MATLSSFADAAKPGEHIEAAAQSVETRAASIHEGLRSIETRNWWTLFTTITILLLLMFTIVCLSLPSVVQSSEPLAQLNLDLAVRGLLGVVLLFNVYSIWQQIRLKKLCEQMKDTLKSIGR